MFIAYGYLYCSSLESVFNREWSESSILIKHKQKDHHCLEDSWVDSHTLISLNTRRIIKKMVTQPIR